MPRLELNTREARHERFSSPVTEVGVELSSAGDYQRPAQGLFPLAIPLFFLALLSFSVTRSAAQFRVTLEIFICFYLLYDGSLTLHGVSSESTLVHFRVRINVLQSRIFGCGR
jgi:hypothetical protein